MAERLNDGARMLVRGLIIMLLGLHAYVPLGYGAEIQGLYEAKVGIPDESSKSRARAIKTALRQMVIKVTGGVDVPGLRALSPVFSNPTAFVQQYRYERPAADDLTDNKLYIRVSFDQRAVNRELRNAGLPVWGSIRPTILVWLAFEDRIERYLVGEEVNPGVSSLLADLADKRGIPIRLPKLDSVDQQTIQFTDVWGGFKESIIGASQRYQPDAILVGRVYRDEPDGWQSRWTILHRGQSLYWTARGYGIAEVLSAGIDGAVDTLASHFVPTNGLGSEKRDIVLNVSGITGLSTYARLIKYIEKLEPVEKAEVIEISTDAISLKLRLRSGLDGLRQVLKLGKRLAPMTSENPQTSRLDDSIQNTDRGPGFQLFYQFQQ